MLNITKATRSQRWVDFGDEKYLVRFTPSFEGLKDFFDLAKEIIVDWNGIVGADNQPLPCTDEVLIEFVRSDEGIERLKFLMQQAANYNGFTRIEALLKNLMTPLGGVSTGQAVQPNGAPNANESVNQQIPVKTVH